MVVVGDQKSKTGDDKRRKREAFVAVHKLSPGFDHVQTLSFPEMEKNFIHVCKDPESNAIFAFDLGTDAVVFRLIDGNISVIQKMKAVHSDYPFMSMVRGNKVYTCSTTNCATFIEFKE